MAINTHRSLLPNGLPTATITSLSHEGRGVARVDGKIVFIDDALPGERVRYRSVKRRKSYDIGAAVQILTASPQRVTPKCEYFGICGGCIFQHLASSEQIASKQELLLETLAKIGKTVPETIIPPITGPVWGYRRKARLGVRYVLKKGGVLLGFRERQKSFITPIERCAVLDPKISALLPALRQVITNMSCYSRLPQIEAAAGDNAAALVFRHLEPLNDSDLMLLTAFAKEHHVQVFLQPNGLDSIYPLAPENPVPLFYRLNGDEISIEFGPTDFVQINQEINQDLVALVISLLQLEKTDRVLDLFCGLGNFTLPIARSAVEVVGIEGDPKLVEQAKYNAGMNGYSNVRFVSTDLCYQPIGHLLLKSSYDKVLLDPPRTGAMEIAKYLPQLSAKRIVYVSCNPATLARDAEIIVHMHGYRLTAVGIVDMFPHTNHVESIAVFESSLLA